MSRMIAVNAPTADSVWPCGSPGRFCSAKLQFGLESR